jgi:hypothetical protein
MITKIAAILSHAGIIGGTETGSGMVRVSVFRSFLSGASLLGTCASLLAADNIPVPGAGISSRCRANP